MISLIIVILCLGNVQAKINMTDIQVRNMTYMTAPNETLSPPNSKEIDYTVVVQKYRKTSITQNIQDFSKKELFWVVIGLSCAVLVLLIVSIRLYYVLKRTRMLQDNTNDNSNNP
jgi:hypothetical protein